MPLLIEKNLFQKLIDTFLKAKSEDKEKQFISKIKHADPKIGAAFSQFDDIIVQRQLSLKKTLEKYGLDTSEIDNFLSKYYDIK
jgi:hypothetical protein